MLGRGQPRALLEPIAKGAGVPETELVRDDLEGLVGLHQTAAGGMNARLVNFLAQ